MSDHHHYGYADERHGHRGEYADDRHDHSLDYAEKYHRHYDEESRVAGLREDLSGAEARIYDMDREIGEVQAELRTFKDHVAANLASLNEIMAELVEQAIQIGVEPQFARMTRGKLRDHSWALGYEFQGERGPAGEPDEPEPQEHDPGAEIDDQGGMSEHPFLVAPDERPS